MFLRLHLEFDQLVQSIVLSATKVVGYCSKVERLSVSIR
jgi:hypothetical protein